MQLSKKRANVRRREMRAENEEYRERKNKLAKDWRHKHIGHARKWGCDYRRKRKILVLSYYSVKDFPICECCGETYIEFLCLDHKNRDGKKHREKHNISGGTRMYTWAMRNNFPPIFKVLCHNCNESYGLYGYCPHQKEVHHSVKSKCRKGART